MILPSMESDLQYQTCWNEEGMMYEGVPDDFRSDERARALFLRSSSFKKDKTKQ